MSHLCRLSRRSWKRDSVPGASVHAGIVCDAAPCEGSGHPRPAREAIARLAHAYWEARGREGGSAVEDWVRAERELAAALEHR